RLRLPRRLPRLRGPGAGRRRGQTRRHAKSPGRAGAGAAGAGGVSAALAEKLRALQRQAGKPRAEAAPSSPLPPPRPEVPENIRRLLGLRTRTLAAVPSTPRVLDRHLPGEEIAPGLRYLESRHEAPAL